MNFFNLNFFSFFFATGLLSWNSTDCHVNLEEELSTITALALDGEEGKNGKDYHENPCCVCMSMRHFQRHTSKSFLNRSQHKPNKLNGEKLK